ncbi:restriction endonuclease [bacterium]|nr:restriction endonuclease [bacterium]MDY2884086.1 restriction endonuclease [Bariatricus sp.]
MNQEEKFNNASQLLKQAGYTLSDFMRDASKYNSSLVQMKDEDLTEFQRLYDEIDKGNLSRGEKGKKLEELTTLLFEKSVVNLLQVYKNCRTSTNEIDLLVKWTDQANLSGISQSFSFLGDSFLCECKNYEGAVGVTYVGKFCSLMLVTNTDFGVMISWDGVTGRSKWSDSQGLIKKFALSAKKYIIVLEKNDIEKIYTRKKNLFSLIHDKYLALKDDIDYQKYIATHDAEHDLK